MPEMTPEFIQNLATKVDIMSVNQSLKDIHEDLKRILDKLENRVDNHEVNIHNLSTKLNGIEASIEIRPTTRCIDAMKGVARNVVTEMIDSNNLRMKAAHEEWHEIEKEKAKNKWKHWSVVLSVVKGLFWISMTLFAFIKLLLPNFGG